MVKYLNAYAFYGVIDTFCCITVCKRVYLWPDLNKSTFAGKQLYYSKIDNICTRHIGLVNNANALYFINFFHNKYYIK